MIHLFIHYKKVNLGRRLWTSTGYFGPRKQTVRLLKWFKSITSWNEHWIDSDLNRVRYFATGSFTNFPLVVKENFSETRSAPWPRVSPVRSYFSVKSTVHHLYRESYVFTILIAQHFSSEWLIWRENLSRTWTLSKKAVRFSMICGSTRQHPSWKIR